MKFSIIIPAHNEANNIRKALESIKAQTYTDYELIVVCDACEDNTKEIAEEYADKVYEVDYHSDGMTRNYGLERAKGDWVLFCDADDWYLHEYVFDMLAKKVGKENEDMLCFAIIWKHIGYSTTRNPEGKFYTHSANKCWRRASIGNIRFPQIAAASDAVFFEQMVNKGIRIVTWEMPLYYYNYLREGSISKTVGRTVEGTKNYWRMDNAL